MKLLALDIGGTNCRFAHCHYTSVSNFQIETTFDIATRQKEINCFEELLNFYEHIKAEPFLAINEYDLISIAIAGPVFGKHSCPPNIPWDIDLEKFPSLPESFLLNDFVAQAYALLIPGEIQKLEIIKDAGNTTGTIALVGAGTGLGHCMLVPVEDRQNDYQIYPSEAGQAAFAFTHDERELEAFILNKTRQDYVTNDRIVSGTGLSLIHEFLHGVALPAKDIFLDADNKKETLKLFSRFYGRACRNYCLSSCITGKLIISGGIAAKQPELVGSHFFLEEFENSSTHRPMLENISIYLNKKENIGLSGAVCYALQQHFAL